MKKFKWPTYQDLQKFPLPCNVIEKIQYDYEEIDSKGLQDNNNNNNISSWFGITLLFPEPSYKEIKQAQAYNIESFVGNAGGYIGLFLGYSLMCIPGWIRKMFRRARLRGQESLHKLRVKKYTRKKNTHRSSPVAVAISRLDKECSKEIAPEGITKLVQLMKMIDQRQGEMEHIVKNIKTKLDGMSPAYSMTQNTRLTSDNVSLWGKRNTFYFSDEVLIK